MLKKFTDCIDENFSFIKNKKILIGVSGGVDSIVLTHLMHQLGYDVFLAHCNFKLREKESNLDESFVKEVGKKLSVKTFSIQFDTKKYAKENKRSIQLAARELRYNWFEKLLNEYKIDYVATAHHSDDNLETFLINLTRGTGLDGLTGIPKQNKNIIRPLLTFSRKEIVKYATDNDIQWREDATNKETKYLRNKIRHKIIPILKEINPTLLTSFNKTTDYLQGSQQIIQDRVAQISETVVEKEGEMVKFDIRKILTLSSPKAYLYYLLKTYGFTEWNDVYNLLFAQTGKYLETKTHILLKNREFLLLSQLDNEFVNDDTLFFIDENVSEITQPIRLCVNKNKIECENSILIDENLVTFPLILRKWKKGDVFFPTGMNGKKKVSKYFKDEKISLIQKKNVWLLCNNNNKIIWIVGMRQDRRFSITKTTKKIITITL